MKVTNLTNMLVKFVTYAPKKSSWIVLQDNISRHVKPEIINSGQGSEIKLTSDLDTWIEKV